MIESLRSTLDRLWSAKTDNFLELVDICELNPELDFRGADLRGMDLSHQDLSGFDFTGADLRDCNLVGADLRGAIFDGAVMGGPSTSSSPRETADSTIIEELIREAKQGQSAQARRKAIRQLGKLRVAEEEIGFLLWDRAVNEKSHQALDAALAAFSSEIDPDSLKSTIYAGLYNNKNPHAQRRLYDELNGQSKLTNNSFDELISFVVSNPHPYFSYAMESFDRQSSDFMFLVERASSHCKVGNDYRSSRYLLPLMYENEKSRIISISTAEFISQNRILFDPDPSYKNFDFSLLASSCFEILLYGTLDRQYLTRRMGETIFRMYPYYSARLVDDTFLDRLDQIDLREIFSNWLVMVGNGATHHQLITRITHCSRDNGMKISDLLREAREGKSRRTPREVLEIVERRADTFELRSIVHQLAGLVRSA